MRCKSTQGEWKADKRHGYSGKYIHSNGDEYVGNFYLGKYHGTGRIKYNNGTEYAGEFQVRGDPVSYSLLSGRLNTAQFIFRREIGTERVVLCGQMVLSLKARL